MKHKQLPGLNTMSLVINQMMADTVDEDTSQTLKNMLALSTFEPIYHVIENKLKEIKMELDKKAKIVTSKLTTPIDSKIIHTLDGSFSFTSFPDINASDLFDKIKENAAEQDDRQLYEYENPHSFHNSFNFHVTGKPPEDGIEL